MKRLLAIEINKLFFYKSFWIFISIHAGLLFLVAIIMDNFSISLRQNLTLQSETHIMDFPVIWQSLCWIGSWFHYLLGLLIILLITNDIECRTMRQHVIDGMSRMQYMISQLMVISIIGIYNCLLIVILGFLFGNNSSATGGSVLPFNTAGFLFGSFIQGLGYMLFAMLAALICKRAAIATGVFLIWPIIAEPILGFILDKSLAVDISTFLPFHAISEIIPAPKFTADQLSTISASTFGIALLYIMGMALCAGIKIKTDDL